MQTALNTAQNEPQQKAKKEYCKVKTFRIDKDLESYAASKDNFSEFINSLIRAAMLNDYQEDKL